MHTLLAGHHKTICQRQDCSNSSPLAMQLTQSKILMCFFSCNYLNGPFLYLVFCAAIFHKFMDWRKKDVTPLLMHWSYIFLALTQQYVVKTHSYNSGLCTPDSKVHGANMGPTWVLSAPDGPHVGPMNLAIRDIISYHVLIKSGHTYLQGAVSQGAIS